MPQRVQTLRSSVSHNRPAVGTRQPGELYVNFADLQIGMIDASQSPQDLVAVRIFSTNANYNIGAWAITPDGNISVSKVAITAGAFNATNWNRVATAADLATTPYLPLTGGTLTGLLAIAPATNSQLLLKPTSGWANVALQKSGSGQFNQVAGYTGANARWAIELGDATAETGANNIGSNFSIYRYNDAGTLIDIPFLIDRSRGITAFGSVPIPGNAVGGATSVFANGLEAAYCTSNIYQSNATNGWSYIGTGCGAYFGTYNAGAQILVAPSAPAGSAMGNWTGAFYFSSGGDFSNNGIITAGTQLRAATLNINLGVGTYQVYPSSTAIIKQYLTGWYDSFNTNGGARSWVGANAGLMTLDGSGNLWNAGSHSIVGNLGVTGGSNSIAGNLTIGNAIIMNSNYGMKISGSSHYIGMGQNNFGLFAYSDNGALAGCYVPYGYTIGGATSDITSWGYNSNGNIYASETGGTQRSWSTVGSDRRLKSNITKSTYDALAAINALNVVSCDMKFDLLDDAPSYRWDCALIADEVEPIIPMAYVAPITYHDDNSGVEKTSLAYLRELALTTTLIKAVQQLTEQVQALQARLATLEAH